MRETCVRFVKDLANDGKFVADVAEKLPGRGFWVHAECIASLANKSPRLIKKQKPLGADFVESVGLSLRHRLCGLLGLARKAGFLIYGSGKMLVAGGFEVVFHAAEASSDGMRKLIPVTCEAKVFRFLNNAELSGAIGVDNAMHVGLLPSGLTTQIGGLAARIQAFDEGLVTICMKDRLDKYER